MTRRQEGKQYLKKNKQTNKNRILQTAKYNPRQSSGITDSQGYKQTESAEERGREEGKKQNIDPKLTMQ